MQWFFLFIIAATVTFFGNSCSLLQINTNIPIFYGTTVSITNTSSYDLLAHAAGADTSQLFSSDRNDDIVLIKPGETVEFRFRNWSSYGVSTAVIIKAISPCGPAVLAAASRTYYVNSTGNYTHPWIVTDNDFPLQ